MIGKDTLIGAGILSVIAVVVFFTMHEQNDARNAEMTARHEVMSAKFDKTWAEREGDQAGAKKEAERLAKAEADLEAAKKAREVVDKQAGEEREVLRAHVNEELRAEGSQQATDTADALERIRKATK